MTEPSTVPESVRAHEALSVPGPTDQGTQVTDFGSTPGDFDALDTLGSTSTDLEVGVDASDLESSESLLVTPPTKREREAEWMRSAFESPDLTHTTTADLRVLANRMFRLLDSDRPPLDAGERYLAAVTEIEKRARQQSARGLVDKRRQVFKDSAFSSRFELFLDGSLAAYLRYTLTGGLLTLRVLVESPGFEERGLAPVLLRHAMLHAHKRRLGVVPGCTAAKVFLEQNPQYRALARMPNS